MFEAAIFGGGASDAQIEFLGGTPYGLRCINPPLNIDDYLLPGDDYGNTSQADFFAQYFRYQVYEYPVGYKKGLVDMWMNVFIGITVEMLP